MRRTCGLAIVVVLLAGMLGWLWADAPRPAQALLVALGLVWLFLVLDHIPLLKR